MIRWITSRIGTAPYGDDEISVDCQCIDIRELVDRSGNTVEVLSSYVDIALLALKHGKRIVICCDHGISRSNSLAVAVLSCWEGISMSESVRRVLKATDNAEIRLEVLDAVRKVISDESLEKHGQRWLVSGGHGYLGKLLVSTSPSKVRLYTPSRKELDFMGAIDVDLYVREHNISRIVHFATPQVGNINSSIGDSILMLKNVMDVAVSNQIPLFTLSRWEVFSGYKAQAFYAEDNMTLRPDGVLGYTKYLMEMLAQQYVENLGLKLTLVRSGLVYGRGGAPNFINGFIKKAVVDNKITTHKYLNGLPMLDMIYADDWAEGCWKLLCSGLLGTFHLASGTLVSTTRIAKIIKEVLGSRSELAQVELDENVSNIILGANQLIQECAWKPCGDHNRMIAEFVEASIAPKS